MTATLKPWERVAIMSAVRSLQERPQPIRAQQETIMPLYSVDLKVAATAYIKAATKEEARAKARALKDTVLELPDGEWGEVEISGRQFDDAELPDVSLSPAMTVLGACDIDTMDLAEDS